MSHVGSHFDGNIEHHERQRLAVAVEAEARIDTAFENIVEHEIERRKSGQIVADDARRLACGENLRDALGRHLRRHHRIVRGITADEDEIEPVALVAGARIGNVVQADRYVSCRRTQHGHARFGKAAFDEAGGAGKAWRDAPAHPCPAGRSRAIKRFGLIEQNVDLGSIG